MQLPNIGLFHILVLLVAVHCILNLLYFLVGSPSAILFLVFFGLAVAYKQWVTTASSYCRCRGVSVRWAAFGSLCWHWRTCCWVSIIVASPASLSGQPLVLAILKTVNPDLVLLKSAKLGKRKVGKGGSGEPVICRVFTMEWSSKCSLCVALKVSAVTSLQQCIRRN